jgi:hypothetical protein
MLPFSLDDLLCGVFWFLRKNSLYTKVVRFSFNQRAEFRIFELKTVSQSVIPAKSAGGGREPGSRQRPREGGEPDIK